MATLAPTKNPGLIDDYVVMRAVYPKSADECDEIFSTKTVDVVLTPSP